jgi:hypothetical protein
MIAIRGDFFLPEPYFSYRIGVLRVAPPHVD